VETLRTRRTLTDETANRFLEKTFWHFQQEAPSWLNSLKKSIVLVGEVYDGEAPEGSRFYYCESGLDEKEVRVLRDRPVYK